MSPGIVPRNSDHGRNAEISTLDADRADALSAPRAVLLVDPDPVGFDAAIDGVSYVRFA